MKKILEGKNAEHLIGKPRRKLTKYKHENKYYTILEGEKIVHVEFIDVKVCEQGEHIPFLNRQTISLKEFEKLKEETDED